jgi:hypothetical protein
VKIFRRTLIERKSNLENILLEKNVHFNLLEGLEYDRSLNLIHFIALWPNFHKFFRFCCSFVLLKSTKNPLKL